MRYFPDPLSGWLFVSGLAVILALASYTDERYTKVPKWITLPAFFVGLVVSMLRGIWLSVHGMPVWLLGETNLVLGAIDGLLFALSGVVVGFVIFFMIWILGGCGGGDVKLFAALGAWVGPYLSFWNLLVSMVLLMFCFLGVITYRLLSGRRPLPSKNGRSPVVVRFSLLAAVAVMMVSLWSFREDLGLVRSRAVPST
ncbi:MAG: A24 family peptidase, partial [Gemmataceae bacterium]